ncbi:MAG: SIR2 family protein, partial [Nitrososphaerales archaeon]
PNPDVPAEIATAAKSGELVVFVGAGISRLAGCPGWDQMANMVLKQLVPNGIDYHELSQLTRIADPRRRLSLAKIIAEKHNLPINYEAIFKATKSNGDVYSYLNLFDSAFVTTNYDKNLVPSSRVAEPESDWRFYRREHLLGVHLDKNGNVLHLHGCLDDPRKMVVTTRDYLEHYSSKEVGAFLPDLFARKTVLFLGYGLEEIEVLEYIVRKGGGAGEQKGGRIRRFILQGYFSAEIGLANTLEDYFLDTFKTQLIAFPKDKKNHGQQVDILAAWLRQMEFGHVELVDEVAAIEDEIRG